MCVLYVNKMRVAGLLDGPVHAGFESLFETSALYRYKRVSVCTCVYDRASCVGRKPVHAAFEKLFETGARVTGWGLVG